jgi:hypothetical protein
MYRNVGRLINHLAALLGGLGESSCCKYVTSAAPDVQAKYAAELASRAAGKAPQRDLLGLFCPLSYLDSKVHETRGVSGGTSAG